MEKVFFHRQRFSQLYNCSYYDNEKWSSFGKVNIPIGVAYLVVGIIYESLYIPIIIVMARKEYLQYSCYKIMFFLGIIDIIAIWCNSIMSGYFSLVGAVYCTHQFLIYTVGAIAVACWCAFCMTVFLLAFNRFMNLISLHYSKLLFSGKRTYLWLTLPALYWFYFAFFESPCLYTSAYSAWFFDPYYGMNVNHDPTKYVSVVHAINNVVIIFALTGMYLPIIIVLLSKICSSSRTAITVVQRQTMIQAFLICCLCFVASAIYVWMQFLPTPPFMIVMAQVFWQASHGGAVFIYLIFNKQLRDGLRNLFLPNKRRTKIGNPHVVEDFRASAYPLSPMVPFGATLYR